MSGNFFTDVIKKDSRYLSTKCIDDLNLLEPVFRTKVLEIVAEAKTLGHKLMVFETYRSQQRQEELYKKKKTTLKEVGVHHYGLACDLVKDINGQPSWDGDFSFLGLLAKKHGLIWGGDWGTPDEPHSFRDDDHVQRCSIEDQSGLFSGEWYPGQDYDPYGGMPAEPPTLLFREGSVGPQVAAIQQALGIKADGIYGPQTKKAVMQFQQQHGGLAVDGEVGPLTLAALGLNP
ncbi:MAG: peptidoglycan-binding protein [Desulfobaccales bacterium]